MNKIISHKKLQAEILELLAMLGPSSIFALAKRTHRYSGTVKSDVKKLNEAGKVVCVRLPGQLLVSLKSQDEAEIENRRKLDEFYSQKAEKEKSQLKC